MNSKNKGNTFERKIANLLSAHFEPHTKLEKSFRRNSDSGSFFGGSNQARTETHDLDKASFGDIIAPADFKFSIECKHYKSPPTFVSILKQDNSMLDKWIAQGEADAVSASKHMLLITKFNNVPEAVIVNKNVTNLTPVMLYKQYSVIPLEDFLQQPTTFFFE
jgi:hypothetical protein